MPPEDEETIVEHPLPGLSLPEYHGRPASGMKTSLTGAGNRITLAHDLGTTVVFVVEAKVKGAGHEEGENGIVYVEKLAVKDLFELQGAQGKRLLSAVRSAYRTATDGAAPLEYPAPEGTTMATDASGVVVTPGDAATIADDPLVRSLTDETMTPVVVIYSDAARELWPDEFDPGEPRPTVGEAMLDEHDVETVVVKILDAVTGETLAEWTDEEENARLLAREEAAALEEAKADRVVHDEIQSARGQTSEEALDGAAALADALKTTGFALPGESPAVQVDPPEANEDLTADPAEAFPGYAGDAPDDELEIDDDASADDLPDPAPAEEPSNVVDFPSPGYVPDPGPEYQPTPEDFAVVDREIPDLKVIVAEETSRGEVLRWLRAEEEGRGRKLKPRKGALDALTKRAAELFTEAGFEAPGLPATADEFEPTDADDETEA